ncbi:unnamed protein product [Heligmosomoides polygyrus]|uniref:V-type proton ATPase subunit a n=1 Tax=Heligmosomoides polygyrus TaxID=6339 RepID=A0A183G579_HELPZ|nr:unnamed protein product [Heligmosomoides polygyrus]
MSEPEPDQPGIYRSEQMTLAQLFLQSEAAYQCVAELGELGLVQFRDLNPDTSAFQRKYVNEVRRCDEMERKLRYLEREIKKDQIPMLDTGENPDAPQPREMIDLEATFEKLENELREVNRNEETLKKNFSELTELKHILRKTQTFFEEGEPVNKTVFIIFFQGDQLKTKVKKICEGFRATLYPCPDTPQERREMSIGVMTRIEDLKTVLGQTQDHRHRVLVAASKNVRMWLTKVRKIKSIYHTLNLFNIDVTHKCLIAECWCPVSELDRIKMALKRGTEESGSQVPSILNRMDTTEAPPTYHKTNKFTRGFQNIVDAYGIATYREINPAPYTIISFPFLFAVMFGDMGHGAIMLCAALFFILKEKQLEAARIKDEIFQTFFGGRYLIFLMGVFSIYTGFLYNDVFSKSMNIFGSGWTNCYDLNEAKKLGYDEEKQLMLIPENAYDSAGGPYPIGVDPIWNLAESNKLTFLNSMKMKISVIFGVTQMTFGVLLSYQNYKYFKSRLDINFMFIPQMVFLSCIFIYLCLEIVVKWIFYTAGPQESIFGYKYPGSNCAPSLLIGLINMFQLKEYGKGFVDDDGKQMFQCQLNSWYPGQHTFQSVLFIAAIVCVPVMLFAKPYLLWKEQKKQEEAGHRHLGVVGKVLVLLAVVQVPVMLFVKPFVLRSRSRSAEALYYSLSDESVRADMNGDDAEVVHTEPKMSGTTSGSGGDHGHGSEKFDLGETMVYQAIHTIEFVLGTISHTASYLRLWALSLAHAQLSDVLWTMVFRHSFRLDGYYGIIATYLLFFIFGSLSVFILVLMEGLSAFLHALRLHWSNLNVTVLELSDVLWTMVFRHSFRLDGYYGIIATYLLFFIFGSLSVFILVLMEGLSAFLHALRLHWVEFQSKFYGGLGHAFTPFSFEKILEEERQAEDSL